MGGYRPGTDIQPSEASVSLRLIAGIQQRKANDIIRPISAACWALDEGHFCSESGHSHVVYGGVLSATNECSEKMAENSGSRLI